MNSEQKEAYEWAKNQNENSVEAEYGKTLSKIINILVLYITTHGWCPFEGHADIVGTDECGKFSEEGCGECVLKHIDKLN